MRKNNLGFTLVEILVVIAIIGILVTIVVVAINPVRMIQSARDAKRRTDIRNIAQALENYAVHNKGIYPAEVGCDSSKGGSSETCNTYASAPSGWTSQPELDAWTAGTSWYTDTPDTNKGLIGAALVPTYTPSLPTDPLNDSTHYYRYEPREEDTAPDDGHRQTCHNNLTPPFNPGNGEGFCTVYVIIAHLEVDTNKTYACTNQTGSAGSYKPVCAERDLISGY